MKILLDTCTFLWICANGPKLSSKAKEVFRSADNQVYLSVVSEWEICVKHALGRLPLPQDVEQFIPSRRKSHRIESLHLEENAVMMLSKLPVLHTDPFDRMLVAQALCEAATILTPDAEIGRYPVPILW